MKSQFARLYFLIILIATLVIFSFSEIYYNFFQPSTNYQIDVSQLLPLDYKKHNPAKFVVIDPKTIVFPKELKLLLSRGEIIKLADSGGSELYYRLSDEQSLYQYGPIASSEKKKSENEFYFVSLFYSALALLILGFIWPLFRDLDKLQGKALAFGENLKIVKSDVSTNSNIYPLANTLEKMSHQIVETMRMHQDLSRTIAHEIHTPLARMKFVTELIGSDIEEEHKYRLNADIDEIQQLMAEYLSFERLEHEHYSMEKKQCDVPLFIKKLSEKYLYQNKNKEIDIKFAFNNDKAFFNEHAINRALQNLINNALRYAKSIIKIEFIIDDDFCKIKISDDGIGVGNEAKKLIQPFVRKNSNDSTDNGFGLGLYIVRKILIWHQGHLSLDNSLELGGAIVTLSWPNKR